jgi:hypothetical protein
MPRKLKLFRTAIGFHDAYVAALSKKAALEAWGADVDLFARGAAELVSDPALCEEALAHPGKVLKRLRGSEDEHFAALEAADRGGAQAGKPRRTKTSLAKTEKLVPKAKPKPPRPPRPDRAALDKAEEALKAVEQAAGAVARTFREREKALARERHAAGRGAEREVGEARAMRDTEKASYDRAMARWRS